MTKIGGEMRNRLEEVAGQNSCKITFGETGKEPTVEEFAQWQKYYISDFRDYSKKAGSDGRPYYLLQIVSTDCKLPVMVYARSERDMEPAVYAEYNHSMIRLFSLQHEDKIDLVAVKAKGTEYIYAPVVRYREDEFNKRVYPKQTFNGPLAGFERIIKRMNYDEWEPFVAPLKMVSMAENGVAIARRCLGGINDRSFTDPRNMKSMAAAAECLREMGGLPTERRDSWKGATSVVMDKVSELPHGLARPFLEETVHLFKDVNLDHERMEKAALLAFLLNQGRPKEKWTFNEILWIASKDL